MEETFFISSPNKPTG